MRRDQSSLLQSREHRVGRYSGVSIAKLIKRNFAGGKCGTELDPRAWCNGVGIGWYHLEVGIVRQKWQLPRDPVASFARLAIRNTA